MTCHTAWRCWGDIVVMSEDARIVPIAQGVMVLGNSAKRWVSSGTEDVSRTEDASGTEDASRTEGVSRTKDVLRMKNVSRTKGVSRMEGALSGTKVHWPRAVIVGKKPLRRPLEDF